MQIVFFFLGKWKLWVRRRVLHNSGTPNPPKNYHDLALILLGYVDLRWNEWGEGWLHSSQSFCISAATSIQLFDSAHIWLRTCGRDSAEEAQEDKFVLPYLDKVLNYKIAITSTQCCNLNITVLNQFLSPWDPESRPTTLGTCTFPSLLTVTTWKLSHFLLFCVHVCVFLPCFLISL